VANRPSTAGNSVTWTIPIQVSIRIDAPAGAPAATSTTAGGTRTTTDPALAEALAELEAGRSRKYYDADADGQARDEYYRNVRDNLTPAARYRVLSTLLSDTHASTPPYKPARHVYPWVDLRPNRKLSSIYSGREFEPEELIRRDAATEARREEALAARRAEGIGAEALEAFEAELEATMPFNCEHVVPQSWFGKEEPMRGDLHHLFACEPRCNSFRGNTPYFDFAGSEEAVMTDCGRREGNRFEPKGGHGTVARATLYFLLRFPGEIDGTGEFPADRLQTLLAWHAAEPPGEYERHRNWAIAEKQGNRNPLIDFPNWAGQIDFRFGFD
jgi:endonuclease G, mitochondrial